MLLRLIPNDEGKKGVICCEMKNCEIDHQSNKRKP